MRSATRWPPRISSERRTWSSWQCQPCAGADRRPRCLAGSRRSPTSWSTSGPCSALRMPGRYWLSGELEGVEARLRDAERWLDTTADRRERPRRPSRRRWSSWTTRNFAVSRVRSRVYRAGLALARGDVADTVTYARRALDLVPEDDHLGARSGSGAPGARILDERGSRGSAPVVCRWHGELQKAGHIADAIGGAIALADIRIAQGRLREAMRTYEQALQLATGAGRAGAAGNGRHVRGHERAPP